MDFLERAMAVADSQAPTVDRSKSGPAWLKSFSFGNGDFPIRYVSDEEKCPRGFHPYCVHEVQTKALPNGKLTNEERQKYYNPILCTLSTHGTVLVENEDGSKSSKLAEPCAVCDVYADIQQSFGNYSEDGKFMGIDEARISKGVQEALEDMRQGTCLRYLFPCLVQAGVQQNAQGYDEYIQGSQVFLAILGLQPAKYASDKKMLSLILEQLKSHSNLFSRLKGNWTNYSRAKRSQSMSTADPSELDANCLALLKKYPNVTSYGTGVEGIPGSNKTYSYDQGLAAMEDCWWFKSIRRSQPSYSLDGIVPGLV